MRATKAKTGPIAIQFFDRRGRNLLLLARIGRDKADVNQPPADWVAKPERTTSSIHY